MRELKNAVAAVTGAASGIGRGLAINLAKEGCGLALADIDSDGRLDVVAQTPQGDRYRGANPRFVVDYQYMRITHACSLLCSARPGALAIICSRAASLTGRRILIIAPPSLLLRARIDPTCSSTSFFTIASPRPVPLGFVVTYGSNI